MKTKKWYVERAIQVLKSQNDIYTIEDLCPEIPLSKTWFYRKKLHEVDDIKEVLMENKRRIKRSLRTKWFQSDNATVQIALYRLLSTEKEMVKLTQNRTDITSKGEKIDKFIVEIVNDQENTGNESPEISI